MTTPVPQHILDALTDVDMPRPMPKANADGFTMVGTTRIPCYQSKALVLGSGAAGLRAAVELKRRGIDVLVATRSLWGGTSACSGSDKQTLHTASTSGKGDNFIALANALSAGGAMDADTAYIEAVGSIAALAGLQYLGLPVPQDRYGAVLRYQTDHDEAGRATSCGPRTSRLMVKVLAEEARRLGITFAERVTALRILKDANGHIAGLLASDHGARTDDNIFGLCLFSCTSLVLATGGPGELFRDSVYPTHCFGALGLALEAGIDLVNLTENQFGIGTRREEFPWNLSGTYVQCMPYIYSVDDAGIEHNFLADYYRTTQELATNIFRKGYQWPFHAERMLNYGSSLLDLAVFCERRKGRRVLMDFNRNPEAVPGDLPFSLDRLDEDAKAYLTNNNALLDKPIDRLARMNPLSIELYRRYKRDITQEPLSFDINHQHMNGGIAVDIWGQSNVPGCYAIGEAAGTHGVTRPGGAALNAGQVFALRCAEHINAHSVASGTLKELPLNEVKGTLERLLKSLDNPNGYSPEQIGKEVQARMSDYAGFLCKVEPIDKALHAARELNEKIRCLGLKANNAVQASFTVLWEQMALASEAVLVALNHYVAQGGGSRGARALCSAEGSAIPLSRLGPLEEFRFIPNRTDKNKKIIVRYANGQCVAETREARERANVEGIFFEKNWALFLTGKIY